MHASRGTRAARTAGGALLAPALLAAALLAAALFAGCGGASNDEPAEEVCLDDGAPTSGGEATETEAEPTALGPIIRDLDDAARRTAPNGTATVAILAQGENAFVARLEMEPGAAVPEHRDADEEYIVVLEGRGVITIDGASREIGPGATVFMPRDATVSFQNGDARMVALQVFAGPGSAAKYDRWTPQ